MLLIVLPMLAVLVIAASEYEGMIAFASGSIATSAVISFNAIKDIVPRWIQRNSETLQEEIEGLKARLSQLEG